MADTRTQGQPGTAAPAGGAGQADEFSHGNWQARLAAVPGRVRDVIRGNWQFSLVTLAAILIRVVVILGYPAIMWFNDSFNYFDDAVTMNPDVIRPNGYPFFLAVLLPLHNLYVIAVAQAGMGVGMGILIYALLRRRGVPWWGATLAALPIMFDVFELQLEHMITADTLFTFLVTVALVLCCWRDRPPVPVIAVAGLLVGYATVVRSVGQPMLVVFLLAMLARKIGWLRFAALAAGAIAPVAAYMVWFHGTTGQYAITNSRGSFLYSRVSTFAECDKMHVTASDGDVARLCDPVPPADRPPSGEYIWANNELIYGPYQHWGTPLYRWLSTDNTLRFTPQFEAVAQKFAIRAITSQPVDYARVVIKDTLHTFGWSRQPDLYGANGTGPDFTFTSAPGKLPWWACGAKGSGPGCSIDNSGDTSAVALNSQLTSRFGGGAGQERVIQPWATFIQDYQRIGFLPGTLLGLAVLLGAAGLVLRWRGWGGLGLLPWLTGALLIVLPPLTAGFSYRYVLAAVPAACIAAGLTFAAPRPGEKPAGEIVKGLGRYFGVSAGSPSEG